MQQQKEKKNMQESNCSSSLLTPLVATVEGWAWGKQMEAWERTVVVVSHQLCRMRDENEGALWRGSREVTRCCHWPESGFFAAEKGKWFAEVGELAWAVVPRGYLEGKKIKVMTKILHASFQNFHVLVITIHLSLNCPSMPCSFHSKSN